MNAVFPVSLVHARCLRRTTYTRFHGRIFKALRFSSTSEQKHLQKLLERAQIPAVIKYEKSLEQRGYAGDTTLNRMLLDFYAAQGACDQCSNVFGRLAQNATSTDVNTWLQTFVTAGKFKDVVQTVRVLLENRYPVTPESISTLIQSIPFEYASEVYRTLKKSSFQFDLPLHNSFLQLYEHDMQRLDEVWKTMSKKRVPESYSLMLKGCIYAKDFTYGMKIFQEARTRKISSSLLFSQAINLAIAADNPRLLLDTLDYMMFSSGSQAQQRFQNFIDVKNKKTTKGSLQDITDLMKDFIDPKFIDGSLADALCYLGSLNFELHDILRCILSINRAPTEIGLRSLEKLIQAHHIPHVTRKTIQWGEDFWFQMKKEGELSSSFEKAWATGLCRLCFQVKDTERGSEILDICFAEIDDFTIDVTLATAICDSFFQDLSQPVQFSQIRTRCGDVMAGIAMWEPADQAVFLGVLLNFAERSLTKNLRIPDKMLNSLRNDISMELLKHISTKVNLRHILRVKPIIKERSSPKKKRKENLIV